VTLDEVNDAWLAVQNGPDGRDMPVPQDVADELKAVGLPRLIASGRLQLSRARIIDSFGRFRDLPTDGITLPVALESTTRGGAKALSLPPRLSLPARIMWRFVDPADPGPNPAEGQLDQAQPSRTISPISGYILPDFMDESIEFFDRDGTPLGEVIHDPVTGGLIWEGGVGREGPAVTMPEEGLPPSARACGRIAQGMIDADIAQRANPETEELESRWRDPRGPGWAAGRGRLFAPVARHPPGAVTDGRFRRERRRHPRHADPRGGVRGCQEPRLRCAVGRIGERT
jgi:hypothetical protein